MWDAFPSESNLYSHDGNPDISMFTCDMSGVTSGTASCAVTDGNAASDDIVENAVCSNRGICDVTTGKNALNKIYVGNL